MPGWFSRKSTPLIQSVSRRATVQPIHTIVAVALLASTSYIGLIESSIFNAVNPNAAGKAHWSSLVEGSRQLIVGPETEWRWQTADAISGIPKNADHLALLTFVFPESSASNSRQNAPALDTVPLPQNLSITALPSTLNPLAAISQDTALAFALPYAQAPEFLAKTQELPNVAVPATGETVPTTDTTQEQKMWIMKAAGTQKMPGSMRYWAANAWTEFVDLIKNAETLDIVIMVLGYMSMHLTFFSLFGSMRQMGSNFWLFATTIFSSVFAFLFGLLVTTWMGVPINMVLLSEGLPFLVVTIGFEKAIALTRAVLSAALETRRPAQGNSTSKGKGKGDKQDSLSPTSIQYAVKVAINEKGFGIVRDYAIEILILVAGAMSGVQGGLQQFCFLAAWILFFDCLLLFTFYTAILSIKLEINRIKRHVALRQALEDDGVSRRVAEDVAQSDDWPRADSEGGESTFFGRILKESSIPKFKILMVAGFIVLNVFNLSLPFLGSKSSAQSASFTGLSGHGFSSVMTPIPMDPWKVASNGLDYLHEAAKAQGKSTVVTVLTPIKYELEYPSIHYATPSSRSEERAFEITNASALGDYGMSGRLLKSLEDPILSKWIIMALVLSVILNGYLFNAARWSIKDPLQMPPHHAVNPDEVKQAEKLTGSTSTLQLPGLQDIRPQAPRMTPATTDDEEDVLEMRPSASANVLATRRPLPEVLKYHEAKRTKELSDEEIIMLCLAGKLAGYALEKTLGDCTRAVKIRRSIISRTPATSETTGLLEKSLLPFMHYDYDRVLGACCENVIGYLPLPVGVAGPLIVDGQSYFIPMATTEGVLVASCNRGMKLINSGGGAQTVLYNDGMTRGPCISFETSTRAGAAKLWLDSEIGKRTMQEAFDSTSRFARFVSLKVAISGTYLYPRFKATTGDAMGMNMISKGVENALNVMSESGFDDMHIVSVSGNFCTDKKASALNWVDGRGKSVVAEVIIPAAAVLKQVKVTVDELVHLNTAKNLIGSAMAGSIGGFNAQAANIIAAVFLATGQDPAQVVEGSNCMTQMKKK